MFSKSYSEMRKATGFLREGRAGGLMAAKQIPEPLHALTIAQELKECTAVVAGEIQR